MSKAIIADSFLGAGGGTGGASYALPYALLPFLYESIGPSFLFLSMGSSCAVEKGELFFLSSDTS